MEPIPIIAWNRLFSFLNGSEFHIGTVVLFEAKIHAPGIRLEPKIRRYTSSKYSVTGKKRRRCEFFTTGCASCRKNRPIDFFEASCGACAPRSVRKRGNPREAPRLRTLRHRHSQARRRRADIVFPAADAAGFTENAALPLRVGRSDTCSAAPFYQPLFYIDPLIGLRLIGVLAVRYTLRPRYPPATGKPTIEVLPVRYRRNQLGRYCKTEKCRGVFQNGEKVGLLHEAAEFNTLILSGCTSVHPYNLDGNLSFETTL